MPNLLTNIIIWVYGKYKNFFKIRDYAVSKVFLEYSVDLDMKYEIDEDDTFWQEEEKYWLEGENDFFLDVTNREYTCFELPQNVTKTIFRVHYWYNNERYKYITYDPEFLWPPSRDDYQTMAFTLPITSAVLVDEDDKPVRDVTRKVKRYGGPKGDFLGSDVKIRDLLFYDDDALQTAYPKIQITNALGTKKIVSTLTGTIKDLQLPSLPSKI